MNLPWKILLLGELRAEGYERSVTHFRTEKTRALLAYLAYYIRRPHSREMLIETFWPDCSEKTGRNCLSIALSSLRNQLEPPGVARNSVLIADWSQVQLNPAMVETDVGNYETARQAVAQATAPAEQRKHLQEAVDIYQGALLPALYEDWILPERQRLAETYIELLRRLTRHWFQARAFDLAIDYTRKAIVADPLREELYQDLMRLYIALSQTSKALSVYQELKHTLHEQLGKPPGDTTRELFEQIQQRVPIPAVSAPAPAPPLHPALPEGTVTLLWIDTVGGGGVSAAAPPSPGTLPPECLSLLRRELRLCQGQEVSAKGAFVLYAFAAAGDALRGAVACQQAFAASPFSSENALKLRMVLHTDDMQPTQTGYSGDIVAHGTYLLAAGHGGQILCSQTATMVLRQRLDPEILLHDHGLYRLRAEKEPERLFQVLYPGLDPAAIATPDAPFAYKDTLPFAPTRFFGREQERARLLQILGTPSVRLVTLTGPGGIGKTRLALEMAHRQLEHFRGAICYVPLAHVSGADHIPEAIWQALRMSRAQGALDMAQIVQALEGQPTLLVLDNFEHLLQAGAPLVALLLERLPRLQCLVTSRQSLRVQGEVEWSVLPLPTPQEEDAPELLARCPSVQIFVDRAQAVRSDFQITRTNAPALAKLCDRLEGVPLALELAAARAQVLTPDQMLTQMEDRFAFLTYARRDATSRHRTLRAAMDWSYALLSPELQRFFAQLSLFRGGATLEAIETVCEEPLALDLLAQLRECSLLEAIEQNGEMRFRMLETLREYAVQQLDLEARTELRKRHADYYRALAQRAERNLLGSEQAVWLDQLEAEQENLRESLRTSPAEQALALAGALHQFWYVRGDLNEGRTWLEKTLAACPKASLQSRAKALNGAAMFAWAQGDLAAAQRFGEEALSLLRRLGDPGNIAGALNNLGFLAQYLGQPDLARARLEESVALYREREAYAQVASTLNNLGALANEQGAYAAAVAYLEEARNVPTRESDPFRTASLLHNLGVSQHGLGNTDAAQDLLQQSLALFREIKDKHNVVSVVDWLGVVAWTCGNYLRSARLLGGAARMREGIGGRLSPTEEEQHTHIRESLHSHLGKNRYEAAYQEGKNWTQELLFAYAASKEENPEPASL